MSLNNNRDISSSSSQLYPFEKKIESTQKDDKTINGEDYKLQSKSNNNVDERNIYELSIVILTYNSSFENLMKTLESSLNQDEINFEIIIADDGSKENHEKEIRDYFLAHDFTNFQLVLNRQNRGTVQNLLSALDVARGEYVKPISPGDLLKNVSCKWIKFMKDPACSK